jgi:amino acid adenylation domain-containing protein
VSSHPITVSADPSSEDEELLAYLLERESESVSAPVLARRTEATDAPLSFAQQRLWVLDRLEGDNPAFRLSIVLGLEGPLDRVALCAALEAVVARHEVLRTRFVMVGDEPVQRVASSLAVEISDTDLDGVCAEAQGAAAAGVLSGLLCEPFDLEHGPLIRARLVRFGPESHRLLLVLHHLVGDRWSMLILSAELALLYRAFASGSTLSLPELPVQYGDYALWERRRLQGPRLETLLAHWRRRLAGLERFELPLDRPRPVQQTFVGSYESTVLPFATVREIERVARQNGATRFMALLAVLAATLSRFSGSTDVAIGTVTSSRSEPELEPLIGLFLNTLVLRVDCTNDPRFTELLGRTREATLDAYAHQEAPFERIVHDLNPVRAMNRTPLFEVLFVQVDQTLSSANSEAAPAVVGALRVQEESLAFDEHKAANTESVQYDLEVYARETSEGVRISFVYNLSLFEARTVRRMLAGFEEILARVLQSPQQRLSQLTAVVGEERRQLLEDWNATQAAYARDQGLHELFEEQARRAPERIAVVDRQSQLRYGELDAMANRVAQVLVARGVGRGQRVGLCVERGAEMVAAVLGILKSGAAYVPLDPGFPGERLRFMAQDAELSLLVSSTQLAALFELPRERQLLLDADAVMLASAPSARPAGDGARGEDPAYVIYTSGSTGTPKGVVVPHRAVVNFLTSMAREPGLHAQDVLVAVTTLSFDIAVLELQLPLAVGARVVLATREESIDGRALAALLHSHGANVMQATPGTWRLLLAGGWSAENSFKALVGGEALPADLAAQLLARGVELWNMYGPTETTVWSTCARVTEADAITIGRPIANTIVRVLDAHDRLCPIGVGGELCIGGEGLSLGYWKRPELTTQKFVADPYAGTAQAKLYRTGDRARWRDDGCLEHLGRVDEQVKVRGYRIEPAEIEAALVQEAEVREAVVVAREDTPGDKRLVAYVVASADTGTDPTERLRARLRTRLPEYMVPSHFVHLATLPRTPNGKLDRRALPAPERTGTDGARYVAPRTPTEEMLAAIWAEVLKVERVGVEENFFDLGGHSLLVVAAIERMRTRTGIALSPREYMMQNLRQIAARYERALSADADAYTNRGDRVESLTLAATGARPTALENARGQRAVMDAHGKRAVKDAHGKRAVPLEEGREKAAGAQPAAIEPAADPEPVFFGRGGSMLFGCFHPAHEPVRAGRALVICQPFGQEYVRCHRLLRVLAASLARSGIPVLRFDYHGCGDSPGENEDATLERCIADVDEAVRFVRSRTRVSNVDLCGLRLGASIALQYAAAGRGGQIERLVLWEPIVRGEDFLVSMREQSARFRKWMKNVFRRAALPGESDGPRDFIGFRFSETLTGELTALDLLQVTHAACRHAFVLDNGGNPRSAALQRRLAEVGVQAQLVQTAAPKVWLAEPYQGLVPRDSLELVSRWLLEAV